MSYIAAVILDAINVDIVVEVVGDRLTTDTITACIDVVVDARVFTTNDAIDIRILS